MGERAPGVPDQVELNPALALGVPLRWLAPLHECVAVLDARVEERAANPARFHWVNEGLGRARVPKKLVVPWESWCQSPALLIP
jgi:hypothetical protein